MSERALKIATRGSELALWQAHHVRDAILAHKPEWRVDLLIIKTTGDKILDRPLAKIGGKALFVKEIEMALIDNQADIAVHSMKDVPAELAPGLFMAAVSSRESPYDALCSAGDRTLTELPANARLGTSSLRRQCQLLAVRPDLQVSMLRGNVPTRLAKLDAGQFDAIVLAAAGLRRLQKAHRISQELMPEVCVPAVGQGVLGIETRMDDDPLVEVLRAVLHDPDESLRVTAERAFLARLGGSCQTPLAGHATNTDSGELRIDTLCGMPDGTRLLRSRRSAVVTDDRAAAELGRAAAEDLLAAGAQEIIDLCV